jgi:hypothetical protein
MGEGAGEDGWPMRGLQRLEERRMTVAAVGPREEGLEWRKIGVGVTEETLTPTAL